MEAVSYLDFFAKNNLYNDVLVDLFNNKTKGESMKILATIFAVCFSSAAFSAVQVSPGNELVSECDLPSRGEDFRTVGTLSSASGRSVKKEITAVGKEIKQGDAVYYVQLEKSKTYYTSSKQVEIKDQSPLTPDAIAEDNKKFGVYAYYTYRKTGEQFILLEAGAPVGPIVMKSNGKLCSVAILSDNNGMRRGGLPQIFQDPNVPFQKIEESVGDGNTVAVAISLKESDAVSATFDVAVLRNGRVENRKTVGFDKMAGEAKIGEMTINFAGGSSGNKIRVTSLNAPTNWASWLDTVFLQSF